MKANSHRPSDTHILDAPEQMTTATISESIQMVELFVPGCTIALKGVETSMGYVSWIGKYTTQDPVLTALLRKAGAVFYVKTGVPQSLVCCETFNNVIGLTVNPRGKTWLPGGSHD